MQKNNLLVGIAILLAATACTQGRYLGVDADDIARTAEGHHGSDAWATNKKRTISYREQINAINLYTMCLGRQVRQPLNSPVGCGH